MTNKVYVVTGAASGIGRALVERLALNNTVFAGYRRDGYAEELRKLSDNVIPFKIDMCDDISIENAVMFIKSKTQKIDTLVNVAGCVVAGAMEGISVKELRRQFDTNVFGHVGLTQGLLELLDGGKIINISSMSSYGIFPFIAPYCASKRALDILFNSFLLETKRNIKVVSIKPGVIATPLWNKSIEQNTKSIEACKGFEAEMSYMIKNADKNQKNGAPVEKVVETILKADSAKNPKLTYTVGKDAFAARLVSKLPQVVLNKIIKSKVNKLGQKGTL